MPNSQFRPATADRDVRTAVFVGALVAVALLIMSATGLGIWQARKETFRRADTTAENILIAVSKDLEHSIDAYSLSLRWIISSVANPAFTHANEAERRQMLFPTDTQASILGSLMVADDTGRVLFDTVPKDFRINNVADAPYFAIMRDNPGIGLLLSDPLPFGGAGEMSIPLVRRFDDYDGHFAGIVLTRIALSFVQDLIRTAAAGEGMNSIALMRDDGYMIAREPWDTKAIGHYFKDGPVRRALARSPAGTIDIVSLVDGVPRHYRYTRVGRLPLVLLVGRDYDTIYAGWWSQTEAIGAGTGLMIILLLYLAWMLRNELARRRRAEILAQDGAEQFRILASNASDIITRANFEGVRSYTSPSIETILGYTPQEMTAGRSFMDIVHSDDKAHLLEALAKMRAGLEHINVLYRARKRSGDWVWLEANAGLLRDPATGEPREIIAVTRDVTTRHSAEMELKRLATVDGLTGIANRRAFDEALDAEWRRALRTEERVALLLLDADFFKLYNDRYGHQAGDDVLRMVARHAAINLRRPGDLAARYGGEEFAVLLPGCDLLGASTIAEEIRLSIQQANEPHTDSPLGVVTVSIGVACCLVNAGEASRGLIDRADAALYIAKRAGRNRVVTTDVTVSADT